MLELRVEARTFLVGPIHLLSSGLQRGYGATLARHDADDWRCAVWSELVTYPMGEADV
jgi:hypothetical protein